MKQILKKIMSKTITVYWCALDPEWLRAEEPVDIYKNFIKNSKMAEALSLGMCPGFKDYSKNYCKTCTNNQNFSSYVWLKL